MQTSFMSTIFAANARKKPQLARRMIAVLSVKKRWMTSSEFISSHGFANKRECSLGREAANGRIIFGPKGFKLLYHATEDDVAVCLGHIRRKRIALDRDQIQIERRVHRIPHIGRRAVA